MTDQTPTTPPSSIPPAAPAAPAYQSTGYAAPAKWNVLSIVTLVLGVLGFAIIPLILGFVSLNQIKKTGEQGKVLAIIGLVLGGLTLLAYVIIIIVVIIAAASGVASS